MSSFPKLITKLALATELAWSVAGFVAAHAQSSASYVQGYRDTYEHARAWQSFTDDEQKASGDGVEDAYTRMPGFGGDLARETRREHPERALLCSDEPSEHLRNVCSSSRADALHQWEQEAADPDYKRGEDAMTQRMMNCEIPSLRCTTTK